MLNREQLELYKLRAMWWMTSAQTGHCLNRNMKHGNGIAFTDQEKINDAVETAHHFITLYQEHLDKHLESLSKSGSVPPGPE